MLLPSKPLVISLIGPTATGKTDLSIEIAKYFGLNIHNIDSRQIYREMDIGTAKPTKSQQREIKHFLIDIENPNKRMNVKEFQEIATKSINREIKDNLTPLLVGGSGLYMNAIIKGFKTPDAAPKAELRKKLAGLGQEECWGLLKLCDPQSANKINYADNLRTIRALEVFYSTGLPISSQQYKASPPWKVLELGLDREDLNERILYRTREMFQEGIIDETKTIIDKYGFDLPLLKTIGYEQSCKILQNILDIESAIHLTAKKTKNFAKRQRTWFRNKNNPIWLDPKNPLKDAIIKIESELT